MLVRIIGGHGGMAPGFRNTSYLLDGKLLLDAGSVSSGLLIEEQAQIENILISHPHLDHISDLAFLADNCFGMKKCPFNVYANQTVRDAIKKHLLNDMIWPDFTKIPSESSPTLKFFDLKSETTHNIGEYTVFPVSVNHPCDAFGFIIGHEGVEVLFTQDTGPTERIWQVAKERKNLKAIFTEVSFPNALSKVALDSYHHTPETLVLEMKKMPKEIPIFIGHLKPNYQTKLFSEIEMINQEGRITIMGSDDTSYVIN